MQQQWTISQLVVICNKKWIIMWQPAQWMDREEAPKNFPMPNLHQKRVLVTAWWFAAAQTHHSFLNPSKISTSEKHAKHTDEMLQKLQRLQPALVNRKGPILHNAQLHVAQPTLQKLNKPGYKVLPHLPYSPDLSPTDYHFFKHLNNFLQAKCFHNHQEAENAF